METLTLEHLYYIGELAGVIVVIVSVIYLALQVRQNTQTIRTTNMHAMSGNINSAVDMITNSAEVADIYRRGSMDYDSLDDIEMVRFHFQRIFSA